MLIDGVLYSPTLQPFPQELTDFIISLHHDDPETLRNCALVSRRWTPRSRYHLYHSITIDSDATAVRFRALLKTSRHVAPLVRDLRIKSFKTSPAWIPEQLSALSQRLERVETLRFEQVRWRGLANATLLSCLQEFGGVKELYLSSCSFFDFKDFEDLLLAFRARTSDVPSLSTLSIDAITWPCGSTEPANSSSRPKSELRLESMSISRIYDIHTAVAFLSQTSSLESLRTFAIDSVQSTDAMVVGQLLKRIGSRLEQLKISCRFDRAPWELSTVGDFIDLSTNTELHTLRLTITDIQEHLIPWVPTFLFQAARLSLRWVIIDVWLHQPNQLNGPIWERIEWLLTQPIYGNVQEITFVHHGDLEISAARRAVEDRFRALVGRTLQVEDRSWNPW